MTDAVAPAAPSEDLERFGTSAATDPTKTPEAPPLDAAPYEALRAEAEDASVEFAIRDQKFHVKAMLPAAMLLDLAAAADPTADELEQVKAVKDFLDLAVVKSEQGAFRKYLRTAEPVIEMTELMEVIQEMIKVYSGRPTPQP